MVELFTTKIHFLLIPMIGFAIGLVTNGLAIFMLFHPYEEKRLFGIRLPFTPGAIPKEHKRLAHKIAEAVCDHLLTTEEILAGFEQEDVKECLYLSVSHGVDSILDTDMESISSVIPKDWSDDFGSFVEQGINKLSSEVNDFIASEGAEEIIHLFVDKEINRLLEFRFDKLIDKEHIAKLEDVIKGIVKKVYGSFGLKEKAFAIMNAKLDEFIYSSRRVDEVLSPEILELIEENVIQKTEEITEALFLKMKNEDALSSVEDEVKEKAKGHIKNLRFIPRFISEMPITNSKIDEFLDHFISDVRGNDRLNKVDKIVIKKLKVIMREKTREVFKKEIKEVMHEIPTDTIAAIKMEIERKAFDVFTDDELENILIGELDKGIINFEELEMQKLIPELTEHELSRVKDFVADIIIGGMRKKEIKDEISSKISTLLDGLLHKEIGNLSHVLSHSLVEKIKKSIFEKSFVTIKEQAPMLLDKLDIKMMVEQKVEEFPLDELERIVVQIAGTQLKHITILGGVLGFVIGLIQVLITM